ncbi:hypothetical protein EB169_02215 [archaeon]|nr:hypothetical protein [archaeon]
MRKRRVNNMVMKIKDIRKLTSEQRKSRLDQYRREYMNVKAQLSSGGSIDHTDSKLIGITGHILNETKTSLLIDADSKKYISKKDGHFRIYGEEISFQVQGQLLVGVPKKRSKRKHKNW